MISYRRFDCICAETDAHNSKALDSLCDKDYHTTTLFLAQARSSVVEHYLDTVGVGSSILPVPTSIPATPVFS